MQPYKFINTHSLFFAGAALVLNIIFFFTYYKKNNYYLGLLSPHGEVAYNVYQHNSVKINPERLALMNSIHQQVDHVVDYADIYHESFGPPTQYRSVQDTIGYGVLLGLLWKLSGSLRYSDIQLLQIFLYSLFMMVFYSLALMIFNSKRLAFWCTVAHLFFLPLIYLNVQPMRDIWAYYGVLALLWAVVAYLWYQISLTQYTVGIMFVALCQFIRPALFLNVSAVVFIIFLFSFLKKAFVRRNLKASLVLVLVNISIFWLPFIKYNKQAYERYFVGPTGQWLIEGTGEFENPWGYKLDDAWFGTYMKEKYNLTYGTAQCDEQARREFFDRFKEKPLLIVSNTLKRLKDVLLPGLPWNTIESPLYKKTYTSFSQKLKAYLVVPFSSWQGGVDFFGRQIFMKLFLLLGYLGFFLMLFTVHYFYAILIFFAGIFPSYNCLPSHVEYRYLIPFFGLFSFFTGYALYRLDEWWKEKAHKGDD